jgi:peptide-methionine (S)-S-oxide reductase
MLHLSQRFLLQPVVSIIVMIALCVTSVGGAAEVAVVIPAPVVDQPKSAGALQTAVLAGGCFWGVQGVFQHVKGVRKVLSGYAGGDKATAQYGKVSSGSTGHAESVQITFDPAQVTYGKLLQIYFSVAHDPTQLNRQGPDVGTQYRSAIFYSDDAQKRIAEAYIEQLNKSKVYRSAIVTRVDALKGFYAAEDYHQDFLVNNPRYPYIVVHDLPKIKNLKLLFADEYVDRPVTVKPIK